MAISTATGDKGKADKLFSKIVRFGGKCERCGVGCSWDCDPGQGSHRKDCKLTTAHVITRHRVGTRCDLRNAFCLCASCHRHFEQFPVSFGIFFLDRRGREMYDLLLEAAKPGAKVDWTEILNGLEYEWALLRDELELD